LDATRPLHREDLFPRGLLREPASSLRRSSFTILTRCDQAVDVAGQIAWLRARHPKLGIATSVHAPIEWQIGGRSESLSAFRSRPVIAFCGLGNPAGFRTTLNNLGYRLQDFRTFADHHNYTRDDIDELRRWAEATPTDAIVLTTQKDWVKIRLPELSGRPLAALRIGLQLTGEESELHRHLQILLETTALHGGLANSAADKLQHETE